MSLKAPDKLKQKILYELTSIRYEKPEVIKEKFDLTMADEDWGPELDELMDCIYQGETKTDISPNGVAMQVMDGSWVGWDKTGDSQVPNWIDKAYNLVVYESIRIVKVFRRV